MLANDGSGTVALTERLKTDVMATVSMYGGSLALRCLALAFRHMPASQSSVRPYMHAFSSPLKHHRDSVLSCMPPVVY